MMTAEKTANTITIPDLPDGEHAVLTRKGSGWEVNIYVGTQLTVAVGFATTLQNARELLRQIYE